MKIVKVLAVIVKTFISVLIGMVAMACLMLLAHHDDREGTIEMLDNAVKKTFKGE